MAFVKLEDGDVLNTDRVELITKSVTTEGYIAHMIPHNPDESWMIKITKHDAENIVTAGNLHR